MVNGIIYLIINSINHSCYVGLTTKSINKRWQQHLRSASCGDERPLYCAIRKYGSLSFDISILEMCLVEELSAAECKWIETLGSFKKGYNLTEGGNGYIGSQPAEMRRKISDSLLGHITSNETKQKISDSLKGRKLSQDTKNKISEGLASPSCVSKRTLSMTGKRHSQETKDKISERSKATWEDKNYKKRMSESRRGSGNSRAILTEEDVIRIRKEWAAGGDPKRELSKEVCLMYVQQTGATHCAIFRMLRGHSWKYLI